MNPRVIGCAVISVAAFVGMGVLGLSVAFRDAEGCPPSLQWADRAYLAHGQLGPSPDVGGGDASYIGSTFFGPITRRAYGPPGSSPSTDAAARPPIIALDCGDGTFRTYRWRGEPLPTGTL
ncbi:MAG TPA: hypothetical protein VHK63_01210 [Candidatus Limnocylindria bacterium]|nr:hypothetical protein [Candidatus Limnocylindria bacterium]